MRNVLVTGGSRGLGLGIVRCLADSGYCAIAVARKMGNQLEGAIAQAESRQPGSLQFVGCDLSEIDGIPSLVKSVRKTFGPIYGLVNNAALAHDGGLSLMHNTQIERHVRTNRSHPVVLTK